MKLLDVEGNHINYFPEEILSSCKDLTRLNIACCKLNDIPAILGLCQNLQVLNLSGNSIKELPQNGAGLRDLISLNISNNSISKIPKWVCELRNLSHISLCCNLIQDLPSEFVNLAKKLRVVDISYNNFEQIPLSLFPKESKITYLLMDNNPMLNIPPEIHNLRFLTHLSISNSPYLYELPEEIGCLVKLRALNLCSNSLLKLPPTLHALENLNYLDLSDNKFSHFPVVVCFIPHLKVLLYNNCCHSCTYTEPDPPGWFDRTSLIDPSASMDKLGKAYLNETSDYCPDDDENITLEEALLEEETSSRVANVRAEDLGDLVFKRSPYHIPKLICRLKFLVHLSMQQNGLHFLPNVFNKLKHLKRVYLNDNNLRKIPYSLAACENLTDIILRNNKLTTINVPLHKLPNLERLELSGNNFPASLNEIIKHSNLKALRKYLEALEENSRKWL
ncbi:hypothetical protein Aperf_G00000089732 [Anoplocephala perfoliata]